MTTLMRDPDVDGGKPTGASEKRVKSIIIFLDGNEIILCALEFLFTNVISCHVVSCHVMSCHVHDPCCLAYIYKCAMK